VWRRHSHQSPCPGWCPGMFGWRARPQRPGTGWRSLPAHRSIASLKPGASGEMGYQRLGEILVELIEPSVTLLDLFEHGSTEQTAVKLNPQHVLSGTPL